jgi:hypothetical protein
VNGQALRPEALAKAPREQPKPVEADPKLDRQLVGLMGADELARVLALIPAGGTA